MNLRELTGTCHSQRFQMLKVYQKKLQMKKRQIVQAPGVNEDEAESDTEQNKMLRFESRHQKVSISDKTVQDHPPNLGFS